MIKNKDVSEALFFLHSLAKKDTEFETQTDAFKIVYKYIEQLEYELEETMTYLQQHQKALDKACKELCYKDLYGEIQTMQEWKEWSLKNE